MIQEEIKKFLKPDWRRILIAIILCGIIYGLLYCFSSGECLSGTAINLMLSGPEAFFESLFDLFLSVETPIAEKVSIVIISYILSCLIVYIYDKIKKNQ